MARVFISHARRDHRVATEVAEELRAHGHDPYLDDGTDSSPAWWQHNLDEVDRSELVLALVSPAYSDSDACRLEVERAEAGEQPVVRLVLDEEDDEDDLDEAVFQAVALVDDVAPLPEPEPEPEPVLGAESDEAWDDEAEYEEYDEDEYDEYEGEYEEEYDDEQPVEEPEPAEREPGRGGELLLAVVMVAALAVAVVWVVHSATRSDPPAATPVAPTPVDRAAQLVQVVSRADGGQADAPLPASSCSGGSEDGRLVCRAPASNVRTVTLEAFETDDEQRDGYQRAVQALSGETYRPNRGDCSGRVARGETDWEVGNVGGRAFCVVSSQVMTIVWTDDAGLVGSVTGQPAQLVVDWWREARVALAKEASGG